MKPVLILISLFLMLGSCIDNGAKEKKINIKVCIIDKLNADKFSSDTGSFYSVDIEIINNTDTTISFWTNTCSWDVNFISNNNTFNLYGKDCLSNFPHIIQLERNKKVTFEGIVCFKSIEEAAKNSYRFGFILIKKNEVVDLLDFIRILCLKKEKGIDLIWSEPFTPR